MKQENDFVFRFGKWNNFSIREKIKIIFAYLKIFWRYPWDEVLLSFRLFFLVRKKFGKDKFYNIICFSGHDLQVVGMVFFHLISENDFKFINLNCNCDKYKKIDFNNDVFYITRLGIIREFRNKGLGQKLILKLINVIKNKERFQKPQLIAVIYDKNIASNKIFEKNNFKFLCRDNRFSNSSVIYCVNK